MRRLGALGLRARLALLIVLALAPVVALGAYQGVSDYRHERSHEQRDSATLTSAAAEDQQALVDRARELLVALAQLPEVRHPQRPACGALLRRLLATSDRYANLGVALADGELVCSATPPPRPIDVSDRPWFQRLRASGRFVVGGYQLGRVVGRPVLVFGYPLLDAAGAVRAAAFASVEIPTIERLAAATALPRNGSIIVFDTTGRVLTRLPHPERYRGKPEPAAPVIEAALKKHLVSTTAPGLDGVERLYTFQPVVVDGRPTLYVAIGVARSSAFATARGQALRFGLALLLAGLAGWLSASWVAHRYVFDPVRSLVATADRLAAGDRAARSGLSASTRELARLSGSLDSMADALQDRSELLESLVRGAPVAVIATDRERNVRLWNPAAERLLGWSEDEVRDHPHPFTAADWLDRTRAPREQALAGESATMTDLPMARKDGTALRVAATVGPLRNDAGEVVGILAFLTDVTEVRRLEEERESFVSLVETSRDAIVLATREGRITYINPAGLELLGLQSAEQARGMGPADFTDPEAAAQRQAARLETGSWQGELKIRNVQTGEWIPTEAETVLLRDGQTGEPIGTGAVFRDVRERLRAERERKNILGRVTDGVINLDRDWLFTYANEHAGEMLGRRPEDLIGKHIWTEFPEGVGTSFYHAFHRALEQQQAEFVEDYYEPLGRWRESRIYPSADGLSVYFSDVTERKRVETQRERYAQELEEQVADRTAELEEARHAAERANHEKSEFLSRMSHELRTPLNAILVFAQLLEMDSLGGEPGESVEQILQAGDHLLSLINEVLDLSRIESGLLMLTREPVDVDELVAETLALVAPLAAGKVELRPPTRRSNATVETDRQRLKQVLLNLLANAIQYNHDGGTVRLTARRRRGRLRLGVSDTGAGIAAEDLERVFEPFAQLAEPAAAHGTGLGLAVCKQLVEALGGSIGVVSVVGEGSTFWIELPLA